MKSSPWRRRENVFICASGLNGPAVTRGDGAAGGGGAREGGGALKGICLILLCKTEL